MGSAGSCADRVNIWGMQGSGTNAVSPGPNRCTGAFNTNFSDWSAPTNNIQNRKQKRSSFYCTLWNRSPLWSGFPAHQLTLQMSKFQHKYRSRVCKHFINEIWFHYKDINLFQCRPAYKSTRTAATFWQQERGLRFLSNAEQTATPRPSFSGPKK